MKQPKPTASDRPRLGRRTLDRPPLSGFEPSMDARKLLNLVQGAADAVQTDFAKGKAKRKSRSRKPWHAWDDYTRESELSGVEAAQHDLKVCGERLFGILNKVPSHRDRVTARSNLSRIIYGTFLIAQSGVYAHQDLRRSGELLTASMREVRQARHSTKTAKRDQIVQSFLDEIGEGGIKRARHKRLLIEINRRLQAAGEMQISDATLSRQLRSWRRT